MPRSISARPAGLGPQSPLDIPEILDRTLSYVNKRTLARCAVLVSRQWLLTARRHLALDFAWSDCLERSDDLEHALTFLPRMTRLQWFAGSPREAAGTMAQEKQWAVLLRALETVDYNKAIPVTKHLAFDQYHYNKLMKHLPPNLTRRQSATTIRAMPQDLPTGKFITGLREFELCGDVEMRRFRLLLPLLSTLTRLVLRTSYGKGSETKSWNEPIRIDLILYHCPHLEDLHISSGRHEPLPSPWCPGRFMDTGYIYPTWVSFPVFPVLPLRSLVLEKGVAQQQKDLEDLLAYTPRLKTLKCIGLDLDKDHFDIDRFRLRLLALNLRLDTFTVSIPETSSMIAICPDSQERIFCGPNLNLDHMQYLQHQPNIITSLEIYCRVDFGSGSHTLLHNYLCSSPHLLHLKALHTPYSLDHMDLHGLLPYNGLLRDVHRCSPGIWQCRKLRTLHISIATPTNQFGTSTASARIAFGYIARVCPELREIKLSNSDSTAETPNLDMAILGGLCLLGRLQHLERFSSGTWKKQGALNARNLEWIVESGRTVAKANKRQKYLQPIWKELGLLDGAGNDLPFDDAAMVASQDFKSLSSLEPKTRFDWTNVDPVLREELRYLGLPVEVKAFFDALDTSTEHGEQGYGCFPVLRYLSLCSPGGIELSPEREIKRLLWDKTRQPWIK
ncbi:hypothetical protein BGZ95_000231 [Linnemannia exigua]|uniref:Uncharacterized protein n=1 Tax=Linnemannia exigua TaxID=604196 RepID=A0AAD4H3L2_9FUNG|nr:hypothetical protein BGZ95_000231 [Linnemannia exigua]